MKYILNKIILTESPNVNRMLTVHSDAGYIIISAFRNENSHNKNLELNNKLAKEIRNSGYSYFPVWGGFIETDIDGNEHIVKERSFVITNYEIGGQQKENTKDLKKLGITLCKKYNQQAFLYKPTGKEKTSYYIKSDGSIDMSFSSVSPATAADAYFTVLNKSFRKINRTKAFTYKEGIIYMAKPPNSLYEAVKRKAELFFDI